MNNVIGTGTGIGDGTRPAIGRERHARSIQCAARRHGTRENGAGAHVTLRMMIPPPVR